MSKKLTHKMWNAEETGILEDNLDLIIEESGGVMSICIDAPTVSRLADSMGRTKSSVSGKARVLGIALGKIHTRSKRLEKEAGLYKAQDKNQTWPFSGEVAKKIEERTESVDIDMDSRFVSVPLEKLYGKVDYATFISLIK